MDDKTETCIVAGSLKLPAQGDKIECNQGRFLKSRSVRYSNLIFKI